MHVANPALKSTVSHYFLRGTKLMFFLFPIFSIANEREIAEYNESECLPETVLKEHLVLKWMTFLFLV